MKFLFPLIFIVMPFFIWAQNNLKITKKEIPVKGVKTIELSKLGDDIYFYFSKKDTGLWDTKRKELIAQHVVSMVHTKEDSNWVKITTSTEHILYDLSENKSFFSLPVDFKLIPSMHKDLLIVVSPNVLGIINKERNAAYLVNEPQSEDINFFEYPDSTDWGEVFTVKCGYNAEDHVIYYSDYSGDGITNWWFLSFLNRNLKEFQSGYNYGCRLINPKTGEILIQDVTDIEKYKTGLRSFSYNKMIFYNKDGQPIVETAKIEYLTTSDLKLIVDSTITASENISSGLYYFRNDKGYTIHSVWNGENLTEYCDSIVIAGKDVFNNGHILFLIKDNKVGYYHTNGLHLKPEFNEIEMRLFEDGTYGCRADDKLYRFTPTTELSNRVELTDTLTWNSEMDSISMVHHNISISDRYLILSLRKPEVDLEDPFYGTSTMYEKGSGVYDLKNNKWIIKDCHAIIPFKEHYIVTYPGGSYYNWTTATVYDKDFNLVSAKEEFKSPFVFHGKLYMKNKEDKIIEYDLPSGKVVDTLGESPTELEDIRFYKGYLLFGSTNYSTYEGERVNGFDIMAILSPDLKFISPQDMQFFSFLGDGLVTLAKFTKENPRGRDIYGRPISPSQVAILDIYTGEIISKRKYNRVSAYSDKVMLVWEEIDSKTGEVKVNYEEVARDQLRTSLDK